MLANYRDPVNSPTNFKNPVTPGTIDGTTLQYLCTRKKQFAVVLKLKYLRISEFIHPKGTFLTPIYLYSLLSVQQHQIN